MIALLLTWVAVSATALLPMAAAWRCVEATREEDPDVKLAVPLLALGLLGYATFLAFLAGPLIGKIFSITAGVLIPLLVLVTLKRKRPGRSSWGLSVPLVALMFGCGLIYLSLLFLPALPRQTEDQSAYRFLTDGLPEDATIPKTFSDRLYSAQPIHPFIIDWLSSDRPPLQTGLHLLVRSCLCWLPFDQGMLYQCVGTWVQLFWIPAIWAGCTRIGLSQKRSLGVLGLVACTGFTLLNSTYVWPKLLAGSYGLFAGLFLLDQDAKGNRLAYVLAAISAALGWLAHGGVMFSLIALAPLISFRIIRLRHLQGFLLAAAVVGFVATPWLLYQRYYDPPGDRLLKWHLAGVRDLDTRGFPQALRESYATLNPATWYENKAANFRRLFSGDFSSVVLFFQQPAKSMRLDEFFHLFHAIGILNLGWLFLPLWLTKDRRLAGKLGVWFLLTLTLWVFLMFEPSSTVVHQGSYTAVLTALMLTAALIVSCRRWIGITLSAWHILYFSAVWPGYFGSAPLNLGMLATLGIGFASIAVASRAIWESGASLDSIHPCPQR